MSFYRAEEFFRAKEGEGGNPVGCRCSLTKARENAASEKATGILKTALAQGRGLELRKRVKECLFAPLGAGGFSPGRGPEAKPWEQDCQIESVP